MTKLSNVKGRITYISSHAKQENLYAVYETTERKFWRELAKCNQEEFVKSGTEGKCIEARELIIALPESFAEYQPDRLLQLFTNHFKQNYGTECIAALHHNKRKTNYHIHLIFAERKLLDEPIIKTANRNMFYDENGKHVRTKKEILGEDGEIREGCHIVKKGEIYEKKLFTVKDERFKSNSFLDEVKRSYTELINLYVKDENQKLQVFQRGSVYLATKKIGKRNPKALEIEADNRKRQEWNRAVDMALISGIQEPQIMEVKQKRISEPIKSAISRKGRKPNLFAKVVAMAIETLELMIETVLVKKYKESLEQKEQLQKTDASDMESVMPELLNKVITSSHTTLGTLENLYLDKYDLILANPPYYQSAAISEASKSVKIYGTETKAYTSGGRGIEALFTEWIVKSIKKGGIANIILPDGIFTNIGNNKLKQLIIENCYIDSIISLPVGTFFNTPKKTFILTIHKRTEEEMNKIQSYPVYTYLCSTIGETMDTYRFDIRLSA